MNILFLSAWFPYPPDNGSKIRVYHLLRALAQRHEVTLVAFAFGTAKPEAASELREICQRGVVLPVDPIQRSRRSTLHTFLSLIPTAASLLPEMQALVGEVAATTNYDTVIASTMTMSRYALALPERGTRILEEHNSLSRWMYERFQAQGSALERLRCWLSWRKARSFEAHLYRHFDLVTMVSCEDHAVVSTVLQSEPPRLAIVPNGVDCRYNHPHIHIAEPSPQQLIYNGALSYSANFDAMSFFLTKIYPLIKNGCPEVQLSITGSADGVDLGALPLDPSIRLLGFLDDVRTAVAGAAVMVAPIREGGGSRLKILEAMALGTPVVATSKGAEGLEVVDGEHLLIADDPAAFAAATLRLLREPVLRARLATNARRLVEERYDWSHIGASFVELVEHACHKGP